jgi:hypothetical protein
MNLIIICVEVDFFLCLQRDMPGRGIGFASDLFQREKVVPTAVQVPINSSHV